jgi:hypothetical protein
MDAATRAAGEIAARLPAPVRLAMVRLGTGGAAGVAAEVAVGFTVGLVLAFALLLLMTLGAQLLLRR